MKSNHLLLLTAVSILAKAASSFNLQPGGAGSLVNLSPTQLPATKGEHSLGAVERDVYTMADWAAGSGVQQAEGVELSSYDGRDYFPVAQSDIPAGSPVMFCPGDLVISSSKVAQEFGQSLSQCENQLVQAGLQDKVPLFRIFFKIIGEYEKVSSAANQHVCTL